MAWKITQYSKDVLKSHLQDFNEGIEKNEKPTLYQSCDYKEENDSKLIHKFRLMDDDDYILCYGLSDDNNSERAFDPLDDFGEGMFGCTRIDYHNELYEEGKKVWEQL